MEIRLVVLIGLAVLMPGCGPSGGERDAGGAVTQAAAVELEMSVPQAGLLELGTKSAEKLLRDTGEFTPTLYVHDGEQLTWFALAGDEPEQLRVMSRAALRKDAPDAICYALVYFAELEKGRDKLDTLMFEAGDNGGGTGYAIYKIWDAKSQSFRPGQKLMGKADNLLGTAQR